MTWCTKYVLLKSWYFRWCLFSKINYAQLQIHSRTYRDLFDNLDTLIRCIWPSIASPSIYVEEEISLSIIIIPKDVFIWLIFAIHILCFKHKKLNIYSRISWPLGLHSNLKHSCFNINLASLCPIINTL